MRHVTSQSPIQWNPVSDVPETPVTTLYNTILAYIRNGAGAGRARKTRTVARSVVPPAFMHLSPSEKIQPPIMDTLYVPPTPIHLPSCCIGYYHSARMSCIACTSFRSFDESSSLSCPELQAPFHYLNGVLSRLWLRAYVPHIPKLQIEQS
jgi:hypothetical protein